MPVHETGYRHFEGRFHRRILRWWPMVRRGVPVLLRSKILIVLLVIFLLVTMVTQAINLFMLQQGWTLMTGATVRRYQEVIIQFTVVILIFAGGGVIASDLRANAFHLYGARPITWVDYFKGKFALVGIFLLLTTFVPMTVFYVFGTGTQMLMPPWEIWGKSLLAIALYSALILVVFTSLILMLSSFSKSGLWAGVIWLLGYFFVSAIAEVSAKLSGSAWPRYCSPMRLIQHAGVKIFELSRIEDFSWLDLKPEYLRPLALQQLSGFARFTSDIGKEVRLPDVARLYREQYPDRVASALSDPTRYTQQAQDAFREFGLGPQVAELGAAMWQQLMKNSEGLVAVMQNDVHFLQFAIQQRYQGQQELAAQFYDMDWRITFLVLVAVVLVALTVTLLRLRKIILER